MGWELKFLCIQMLHIYILKGLRNTECSSPYTMTE